jgi:dihydrofolate synthase/folylpolyglutamate synthase
VDAAGDRWSYRSDGLNLADLPWPALAGEKQIANASAAIAALTTMRLLAAGDAAAVATALRSLQLAGRFQVVPGPVQWILDVAHNEPAALVLAGNLRALPCSGRTWCVTAILGDKDVAAVAQALAPAVDEWVVCGMDAPRGLPVAQLAARSAVFRDARQAPDIVAGMHAAAREARPGDRIVVCGSFLAVAPAMQQLGLH